MHFPHTQRQPGCYPAGQPGTAMDKGDRAGPHDQTTCIVKPQLISTSRTEQMSKQSTLQRQTRGWQIQTHIALSAHFTHVHFTHVLQELLHVVEDCCNGPPSVWFTPHNGSSGRSLQARQQQLAASTFRCCCLCCMRLPHLPPVLLKKRPTASCADSSRGALACGVMIKAQHTPCCTASHHAPAHMLQIVCRSSHTA
jgi:hypothetical protein